MTLSAEAADVNDLVRARCVFSSRATGEATDPTAITLSVTDPAGATTSYTYGAAQVTRESAGIFYRDVTINAAGAWRFKWTGTGNVVAGTPVKVLTVRS